MNSLTDQQLLERYATSGCDTAFAELVHRYLDFVYSAAVRMVRDPHAAQDVTQAVFVALAENASRLGDRTILSGWLHRTARNLAANVVRSEVRRRAREQEAAVMNELLSSDSDQTWEHIEPVLDNALSELNESDRDALFLRYFQHKSAREMGQMLATSEAAAQKRVNRALERLRDVFAKRGIAVSVSAIAAAISVNAVQSAPVGFAGLVCTTILVAGTAAKSSTAILATKAIVMTTVQKIIVTAAITAAVGTGVYHAYTFSRLREDMRLLQQQQADKVRQLEAERDAAVDRLSVTMADNERFKSNNVELLKLRGEVGRLRAKGQAAVNSDNAVSKRDGNGGQIANANLPKDTWKDAGFSTPLDALQTRGWAVLNGDRDKFKQSIFISEGARKILMDMFEKMAAANPKEAGLWAEQGLKNNWGIEEGFLMPMVAENRQKGYAGYRVLSQESTTPDETVLEVETQMVSAPAKKETLKLRRFGDDWKFVVDEEMLKKEFERGAKSDASN